MHGAVPLTETIYWIGVDDWETERFENLWPIPSGITYNSYLILDEKVAVIDSIKRNNFSEYILKLKGLLPPGKKIDYLIINHIEPDHSGGIKLLLQLFPELTIVGNSKTAGFLKQFYGIEQNVKIIAANDCINLGRHVLHFHITPMVHWPETMVTYEACEKVLFSGDMFGGFGALNGAVFDDQIEQTEKHTDEILRYFSNVIGRYSTMVQKALAAIADLEVSIIASTHGQVWRAGPQRVVSLYDKWSRHETDPGVVVAYASMYGNTENIMNAISSSLTDAGVRIVVAHNVSKSHPSFIIRDIWKYKALVLGTPTYNTKPFPLIDNLLELIENKMMQNRLMGVFGSYGWSGGGVKKIVQFADACSGWELVGPVIEAHCAPKPDDFAQCATLACNLAQRLSEA